MMTTGTFVLRSLELNYLFLEPRVKIKYCWVSVGNVLHVLHTCVCVCETKYPTSSRMDRDELANIVITGGTAA